jgi:hypothetical protein
MSPSFATHPPPNSCAASLAEIASLERSYFRALKDLRLIHRFGQQPDDAKIEMLLSTAPAAMEAELASFRRNREARESTISGRDSNPSLRL